MQTRLTIKPGQRGIRKLSAQYGEQLVCVRYRYDEERRERLKTVELVIERVTWSRKKKFPDPATIIGLRVELRETAIQRQIKQAGGKWNPGKRLWELRYDLACKLGLEARMVETHLLVDD